MSNKKRIQNLISKKYKASRKVKLYAEYRTGWDFGDQFPDIFKVYFGQSKKDFSTKDWYKEYMQIPPVLPDLPGLRHYVRQLEKNIRNIPVYTAEFHRMAQELRKAREDLQALIKEKTDKFERIEHKFFPETKGLIFPLKTKHLF